MDLNRLYFLHQIAVIRASETGDRGTRDHHHARADGFASRISCFQRRSGAAAAPLIQAACL
jgi:hypothetical protein